MCFVFKKLPETLIGSPFLNGRYGTIVLFIGYGHLIRTFPHITYHFHFLNVTFNVVQCIQFSTSYIINDVHFYDYKYN